jgi:hypothetical protein
MWLHHKNQIYEQAKREMRERENNVTIPADKFTLYIRTPVKLESNWAFGDRVNRVCSKAAEKGLYVVAW